MCKAKEYVNQLKDINSNIISDYDKMQLEVYKCEAKQQDILHEIETVELKGITLGGLIKGFRLYSELHNLRVTRRKAKNELATLEMLKKEYCDKVHLDILDDKIAKKDEKVNNAIYSKRIDENGDITNAMYNSKAKKLQKVANGETKENIPFNPNAKTKQGWDCEIIGEQGKCYIVNTIDDEGVMHINQLRRKGTIIVCNGGN